MKCKDRLASVVPVPGYPTTNPTPPSKERRIAVSFCSVVVVEVRTDQKPKLAIASSAASSASRDDREPRAALPIIASSKGPQ